ncbi:hypothetical protein BJX65DRAFT_291767 [Aspergillus insuetus]
MLRLQASLSRVVPIFLWRLCTAGGYLRYLPVLLRGGNTVPRDAFLDSMPPYPAGNEGERGVQLRRKSTDSKTYRTSKETA